MSATAVPQITTGTTGTGTPPLAIETHGLRKEYGGKVAVHDVTIAVPQGEVFGFLGPNGAGKSTTMKMLLGLAFPTSGTARLLGHPLGAMAAKRRIGFLPEQFRFHEWLRGVEFLDFHGELAASRAPSAASGYPKSSNWSASPGAGKIGSAPTPRGCSSGSASHRRSSTIPR